MTVESHYLIYGVKLTLLDIIRISVFRDALFPNVERRIREDTPEDEERYILQSLEMVSQEAVERAGEMFGDSVAELIEEIVLGKRLSEEESKEIEENLDVDWSWGSWIADKIATKYNVEVKYIGIPHDVLEWDENRGDNSVGFIGWYLEIGNDLEGSDDCDDIPVKMTSFDSYRIKHVLKQHFPNHAVRYYQVHDDCNCCS